MKLKIDIELNLFEKRNHHNPITLQKRKEKRIKLKGNCIVCGKKITSPYRKKLCSAKCAVIWDKQRKHHKKS